MPTQSATRHRLSHRSLAPLLTVALTTVALWGAATAQAVLHDNGPMVTHPGEGPDGTDHSALQTALGLNTFGSNASLVSGYRLADEFVVPAGGWQLDTIELFAYQTGSSTGSTITEISFNIWDDSPAAPGSVVYDRSVLEAPAATGFSGIYRVREDAPDTSRPIMSVTANAPEMYLPAGTYWLDFAFTGSLVSGPWAPPVTVLDEVPAGNGLQFEAGGGTWNAVGDSATGAQFDYPFVLRGVAASLELQAGATQPTGGTVARGAQGVPALAFSASTVVAPGVNLTSLSVATLAADGSSPVASNPVAAVSLYLDADGDGVADDPASPLATSAVAADGTATLAVSGAEVQAGADTGFVLAFDLGDSLAAATVEVAFAGLALLLPGLWLARRGRKFALAAALVGTMLVIAACGGPAPVEVEFRASVTAGSGAVATGTFAGEDVPVSGGAVGPVISARY